MYYVRRIRFENYAEQEMHSGRGTEPSWDVPTNCPIPISERTNVGTTFAASSAAAVSCAAATRMAASARASAFFAAAASAAATARFVAPSACASAVFALVKASAAAATAVAGARRSAIAVSSGLWVFAGVMVPLHSVFSLWTKSLHHESAESAEESMDTTHNSNTHTQTHTQTHTHLREWAESALFSGIRN